MYHVEAWDENESRDTVGGATFASAWAFTDAWALVAEGVGYRVGMDESSAYLVGASALIRRRLHERGPLAIFADAGLGVSYANTPVPVRGTRYNYLLQAGAAVTRRLMDRVDLIGHLRHLHLSNKGLAGSSRNPDIQSLGLQIGIAWRL